jgi:hypothetical protein
MTPQERLDAGTCRDAAPVDRTEREQPLFDDLRRALSATA